VSAPPYKRSTPFRQFVVCAVFAKRALKIRSVQPHAFRHLCQARSLTFRIFGENRQQHLIHQTSQICRRDPPAANNIFDTQKIEGQAHLQLGKIMGDFSAPFGIFLHPLHHPIIRGIGVGGITIPVMTDSYTGLSGHQVPQASVATRIIQNIGGAFGSGVLATIVALQLRQAVPDLPHEAAAYHTGFLAATVLTAAMAMPALLLTNKAKTKAGGVTGAVDGT